jgi:hypothetical protein
MHSTSMWVYLYFYVPLLLILIFSVYFYVRALKHPGLEKLKKFTVVMLGAFACIAVLAFFRFDIFDLEGHIPFSFWRVFGNRLTLVFGLTIFFFISLKLMRHERNTRFMQTAWALIAAFNIASIVRNTFLYFSWNPPEVDQYADNGTRFDPAKLIITHSSPDFYLVSMIYPLCWVIICTISLLKIRKENQRNPALETR